MPADYQQLGGTDSDHGWRRCSRFPGSVFEAASIEGATKGVFLKITFPMILPIAASVVYTIVESFTSPYNKLVNLIKSTAWQGQGVWCECGDELVLLHNHRHSAGGCNGRRGQIITQPVLGGGGTQCENIYACPRYWPAEGACFDRNDCRHWTLSFSIRCWCRSQRSWLRRI